ncbi:MAG: hypothetical protein KF789_14580, partial [Bdellovibrionaceae bacterium]|nr:hypothetical protein [Pseudobdellovibrionaceae bacterium]
LGEIEVVFGLWAAAFIGVFMLWDGPKAAVAYVDSVNFTEPLFVFVIMAICSTRPILEMARTLIFSCARVFRRIFRTPAIQTELFAILTLGPLAGSFITEPAAMTVTALILFSMIRGMNARVLYLMLGVLFVNVSIGGAMTPYAAPPILMVASTWGWDFSYIMTHLGWKAMVVVAINSLLFVVISSTHLSGNFHTFDELESKGGDRGAAVPLWVTLWHLAFLVPVIIFAHHPAMFMGIFLFFLGVVTLTKHHQEKVRLKESLLVAFFLGGIVVFGPFQTWWLKPLLASMGDLALFVGASALTAITDNAALTYLGSQVEGLSETAKVALVAGALAGGGLTVIANAPNPAGYSILQSRFPGKEINPLGLLLGALLPTVVAMCCLWWLPSL